jgi:hypothetical protein
MHRLDASHFAEYMRSLLSEDEVRYPQCAPAYAEPQYLMFTFISHRWSNWKTS